MDGFGAQKEKLMQLLGTQLNEVAKSVRFIACLTVSLFALPACASSGLLGADKLNAVAASSSCKNPVIIKHALKGEGLKGESQTSLSSGGISQVERTVRVRMMGFKGAAELSGNDCADAGITKYQLASTEEAPASFLFIKHMSAVMIKDDPNVQCKPTYTQVYQPPLKLGGAGRVIQVRNGEECEVVR